MLQEGKVGRLVLQKFSNKGQVVRTSKDYCKLKENQISQGSCYFSMHGKRHESGLTEIIPLISISPIWGQFFWVFTSRVYPVLIMGSDYSLMTVKWQIFFLSSIRAHHPWWLQLLMIVASFIYLYGRKFSNSHWYECWQW